MNRFRILYSWESTFRSLYSFVSFPWILGSVLINILHLWTVRSLFPSDPVDQHTTLLRTETLTRADTQKLRKRDLSSINPSTVSVVRRYWTVGVKSTWGNNLDLHKFISPEDISGKVNYRFIFSNLEVFCFTPLWNLCKFTWKHKSNHPLNRTV